jgi:hypothetical protein
VRILTDRVWGTERRSHFDCTCLAWVVEAVRSQLLTARRTKRKTVLAGCTVGHVFEHWRMPFVNRPTVSQASFSFICFNRRTKIEFVVLLGHSRRSILQPKGCATRLLKLRQPGLKKCRSNFRKYLNLFLGILLA